MHTLQDTEVDVVQKRCATCASSKKSSQKEEEKVRLSGLKTSRWLFGNQGESLMAWRSTSPSASARLAFFYMTT